MSGFNASDKTLDELKDEAELRGDEESQDDKDPSGAGESGDDHEKSGEEDKSGEDQPSGDQDGDWYKTLLKDRPDLSGKIVNRHAHDRALRERDEARAAIHREQENGRVLLDRVTEALKNISERSASAQNPGQSGASAAGMSFEDAMQIVEDGMPPIDLYFENEDQFREAEKRYKSAQRTVNAEYRRLRAEATQQTERGQQEQDRAQQEAAIDRRLHQRVADIVETQPDWVEAANYYEERTKALYSNHPRFRNNPGAIEEAFKQHIRAMTFDAEKAGMNAAEVIYANAQAIGYRPGQPRPGSRPDPDGDRNAAMRKRAADAKKHKSLGSKTGGRSDGRTMGDIAVADAVEMSSADWNALVDQAIADSIGRG